LGEISFPEKKQKWKEVVLPYPTPFSWRLVSLQNSGNQIFWYESQAYARAIMIKTFLARQN
jgi:hypothetical protein